VTYRTVGVLYHPRQREALPLAESLRDTVLHSVKRTWLAKTGDEQAVAAHMQDTDLLICIGGDGTVLWAARAALPYPIPIISINKGQLGFLSELSADHSPAAVQEILDGAGAVEERAMVECTMPSTEGYPDGPAIGLNDIVVGRAAPGRPVYLSLEVDGVHLARVRADAMIVATATGSTAYNLSAGGPVLMPLSRELLLTPVAPHLSRMRPIVLPPEAVISIKVETDHLAIVSVDGQLDRPLLSGGVVEARLSTHVARFIRFGPPSDFFHRLAGHLNLSTRRE
jgi:NAD+ kinase